MNDKSKGIYKPVQKQIYEEKPVICEAPKGFGVRHVQCIILFFSISVSYMMKAQMSVTMVAMTNTTIVDQYECNINTTSIYYNETHIDETKYYTLNANKNINYTFEHTDNVDCAQICCTRKLFLNQLYGKFNIYRVYDWAKSTQEMVVYSFFTGYTIMMIPMGIIAQRYGGKLPIVVALLSNAVLSFISPWVPLFGDWIALAVCRLLQGMTQAAFYPCIHTLLGKWAPLSERGRMSSYTYSGTHLGTIVIFPIAGLLCDTAILGWASVFWLCGVLSLICGLLLNWIGSSTPIDHPKITQEELNYIIQGSPGSDITKKRTTPWREILTSKAVWALVITQSGSTIGFLFVLTEIPLYMGKVLNVDIRMSGLYSSLPYIAICLMTNVFGFVSDYLINNKYMSVLNVRRLANTIGISVSTLFLLAVFFVNNALYAVMLLISCLASHSGVYVGFLINSIDLAPNYAGPLMAMSNMMGNLCALSLPVLVSNIVVVNENQSQWQLVAAIVAVVQILANIVFLLFGKAELQPWNSYEDDIQDQSSEEMKTIIKKSELVDVK